MNVKKYLKGAFLGLSMLSFASCSTVPKIVDLSPRSVNLNVKNYDKLHVMLVCGDKDKKFVKDTRKAYNEFKRLGCSDDDIYLLAPHGVKGLENIVDKEATRATVLDELTNFKSRVGPNDVFFFYYTDHGDRRVKKDAKYTTYESYITFPLESGEEGASGISESQLEESIKDLEARYSIYLINACFSGGFSRLAEDSRIVIATAHRYGFKKNKFSNYFLRALNYIKEADKDANNAVSVKEAFEYALEKDKWSRGKDIIRAFFPRPELTYDKVDPAKVFLKK